MFKFAFSVILVAALHQAFVCSVPEDTTPGLADRLKIVGQAALDIFKSVGEFGKNLTTIVGQEVRAEVHKLVKLSMARFAIMALASGKDYYTDEGKEGHIISPSELREFRVVATCVEEVFSHLKLMEPANEVIVRSIREVTTETKGRDVTKEDLQLLLAALNRNFLADRGVRELYGKLREKYEAEVPFPSRKDSKTYVSESLSKNKKFVKSLMNFIYLQFTYNRLTTPRDRFILARSTLELAKNPVKSEQVQSVYDETLSTQCELMDLDSKDFDGSVFYESWFSKLKQNFEKHPYLYEDLKAVEKDVANRKDWDKSIFDLPV